MAAQINGEVHPSSATLQKSIELGDSAYQTFAKPLLSIFARPYQYVSPYVKKADHLGAGALNKIDERLPALKKPTNELYLGGKQVVFYPVVKGKETTDHVFSIYSSECKKVGGEGVVTTARLLSLLAWSSPARRWTGLVTSSEPARRRRKRLASKQTRLPPKSSTRSTKTGDD
ncbi:perilipin-like protein- Mpl1 [Apiospora phragmitis]|uniref:Perilipin-like protein- Mpl1 n=1 Tax=Apiospora phragmitis TaxID=2905665 RepID=A0ABR1WVB3_9PEZI